MKKNIVLLFIFTAMFLLCFICPAFANNTFVPNQTGVYIIAGITGQDGTDWEYLRPATDPYITGGVTMVPLRALSETFGYVVKYLERERQVIIKSSNGEKELLFTIGSTDVLLNGKSASMTQSPIIKNSSTFIPLRYVAEFFGLNVDWYKNKFGSHFIWVAGCALLKEIDFEPNNSFEFIKEDEYADDAYIYELKKNAQTIRGAKINDSYEMIIEVYGIPDKIFYLKNSETISSIVYSFRANPEANTSKYLAFDFTNGLADKVTLYYEL
jgi:hypothetical protein